MERMKEINFLLGGRGREKRLEKEGEGVPTQQRSGVSGVKEKNGGKPIL